MRMKKIILPLVVITLTISLVSCTKNDPVSMRWDLTGCFNPWDNHFSLDTFSTEAYNQGVHDYLSEEGIEVISVTSEFDSSKVELCLACHCKTGRVMIINIPKKERRKLCRLGSNKQFDLDFY